MDPRPTEQRHPQADGLHLRPAAEIGVLLLLLMLSFELRTSVLCQARRGGLHSGLVWSGRPTVHLELLESRS